MVSALKVIFLSLLGVSQLILLLVGSLHLYDLLLSSGLEIENYRILFLLLTPFLIIGDIFFFVCFIGQIRNEKKPPEMA